MDPPDPPLPPGDPDQTAELRAKDRFLAILSHELRAPLTPMLLGVQALARDKALPQAVLETTAMIERNVRLQAHLIDDLLDVTRIMDNRMELNRAPMSLHDAIAHAIETTHADRGAKGQWLGVELQATDQQVSGDAKRLQQVFWNLLKNASKFTPQGGRVLIRSRNEPGGDVVVVEVSDTGAGFEPAAAERIFGAFEQGSREVNAQYGGLGLGLAIARASVRAHGGSITAASAGQGQGATFTVVLPLARRVSTHEGDVATG